MFSACCCSWLWVLNFDSFVTPSTSRATSGPNRSSMSWRPYSVSSGTSWRSAAVTATGSIPSSAVIWADAIGWVTYGSPVARRWSCVGLDGEVERLLHGRQVGLRVVLADGRDELRPEGGEVRLRDLRGGGRRPVRAARPGRLGRALGLRPALRGVGRRHGAAGLGGDGACRAARRRLPIVGRRPGLGHRPKDTAGRPATGRDRAPGPSHPPSSPLTSRRPTRRNPAGTTSTVRSWRGSDGSIRTIGAVPSGVETASEPSSAITSEASAVRPGVTIRRRSGSTRSTDVAVTPNCCWTAAWTSASTVARSTVIVAAAALAGPGELDRRRGGGPAPSVGDLGALDRPVDRVGLAGEEVDAVEGQRRGAGHGAPSRRRPTRRSRSDRHGRAGAAAAGRPSR